MYEGPKWIDGSKKQCAMCTIPIFFSNFEKDFHKNDFKNDFLRLYHSKLVN